MLREACGGRLIELLLLHGSEPAMDDEALEAEEVPRDAKQLPVQPFLGPTPKGGSQWTAMPANGHSQNGGRKVTLPLTAKTAPALPPCGRARASCATEDWEQAPPPGGALSVDGPRPPAGPPPAKVLMARPPDRPLSADAALMEALTPGRSRSPRLQGAAGAKRRQPAKVDPALVPEQVEEKAIACGPGCFWAMPRQLLSWRDPDATTAEVLGGSGVVEFQAALVVPGAEAPPEALEDPDEPFLPEDGGPEEGLPVAFFFTGLGEQAQTALLSRYRDFAAVAPEPFVLVTAARQPGRWWFIDDESYWGWIQGEFRPEAAELVSAWMTELASRPGLDPRRVGLFGFSAGAYAVVELLATSNCVPLSGVGLGGVHGHGQADLRDVPAKRSKGVVEKFEAFLDRLGKHSGVPWIEATHSHSDMLSRWEDASRILGTITARQLELGLAEVSVRVLDPEHQDSPVGTRKNRAHHDYFKAAFLRPEFFVALFGDEAPERWPLPAGLDLEVRKGDLSAALVGRQPRPPPAPPPTSLEVEAFSVRYGEPGWEEQAFELFSEHGFVIVEELLKLYQYSAVLRDCEKVAKAIVGPERKGNRGSGRYSFGVASSTGSMLHLPSYAKHLLDAGGGLLRPLLDLIFAEAEGDRPGFMVLSGGGDFVIGDTHTHQDLHSDIQVARSQNKKLPPPLLSVNYCVQALTNLNGPTRIVPGTQLQGGLDGSHEPGEWRCSRLCPVPAGSAIVRDVRALHGGTPNLTPKHRYLPSVEYCSADLRATNRKDKFPPSRCLPRKLYDNLAPEVQALCQEIVAAPGEEVRVEFTRR